MSIEKAFDTAWSVLERGIKLRSEDQNKEGIKVCLQAKQLYWAIWWDVKATLSQRERALDGMCDALEHASRWHEAERIHRICTEQLQIARGEVVTDPWLLRPKDDKASGLE